MTTAKVLRNDVEQAIRWEPSVHSEKIGVSVNHGVVELDGHVTSYFEKWAAERAALQVLNVTSIASEIKVDLPTDFQRTDEAIAAAATDNLRWNDQLPNTIKLMVTKGFVTLSGTTEWQSQKQEAERCVHSLRGVKGLKNHIELRPNANAIVVKIKIEEALKRDAQIDSKKILVGTSGNLVTLSGSVNSWRERQDAERAAFGAPGVTDVTNQLTVKSFFYVD